MVNSVTNQPKILRGAFFEYGSNQAPLTVIFQFNPLTISRTRTVTLKDSSTPEGSGALQNQALLRRSQGTSASDLRRGQKVKINRETLSFDIRLDATEKLDEGDRTALQYGIAPQLSTLELMMMPKALRDGGQSPSQSTESYAYADEAQNPPVVLFVWGRKKVLPVNITNMQIREEEFNTELSPTRAVVTVSLEVIEGPNAPFRQHEEQTQGMALVNRDENGDTARISSSYV